jgi:hypothetical protein
VRDSNRIERNQFSSNDPIRALVTSRHLRTKRRTGKGASRARRKRPSHVGGKRSGSSELLIVSQLFKASAFILRVLCGLTLASALVWRWIRQLVWAVPNASALLAYQKEQTPLVVMPPRTQAFLGLKLLDYFFTPKTPSFAALATRNLTTVLAGILIFCCVIGLMPVRAFLFCFTSLPKPGKTNSPFFLVSL